MARNPHRSHSPVGILKVNGFGGISEKGGHRFQAACWICMVEGEKKKKKSPEGSSSSAPAAGCGREGSLSW